MIDAALSWLDQRDPPPPFELQLRLKRAIERAGAEYQSVQDLLADAGFDLLRSALRGGDDRDAAKDLLTADALFTYACEAAVEQGQEALDRLLLGLEIDDFQALMPAASS